jgi:hypothetical protein
LKNLFFFVIFILSFSQSRIFAFSLPNTFWPQKDLPVAEYNQGIKKASVLIASRESDFKKTFVSMLVDSLRNDSVYIKVTGISSVGKEDLNKYDAIVFVNTCMAWSIENKVAKTMKKNPDLNNFIVVTTAADSDFKAKKGVNTYDALSSSSVDSNLDGLVSKTLFSIRKLIRNK